ncbi:hypothetical protein DSECCO2_371560 [anaerobic digester metagenome]
MWPISVPILFWNLRRAGVLKKRSSTVTVVPNGAGTSPVSSTIPPTVTIRAARRSPSRREMIERRDTAAIEARASPRKPIVATAPRSSTSRSLLVVCGRIASWRSSADMPHPSSVTRTEAIAPARASIAMKTRPEPASSAFSASSFTTEADRSITSPAAIFVIVAGSRCRIALPLIDPPPA